MRLARLCGSLAIVFNAVSATLDTTLRPRDPSPSPTAPCAVVSSLASAQRLATPTATPRVPAQLAQDCLTSVPLNKTAALRLVDSIKPYVDWQSDLAWLKDPPQDYDFPAHDVLGALASITDNLNENKYSNELDFQTELYSVFTAAHDGHFVFYPDAMTRVFDFGRKVSLVSISEDNKSLPQIKVFEDIISSPKTASIVTEINGINAVDFLTNYVKITTGQQVLDAAYNGLFYSKALSAVGQGSGEFSRGGRGRFLFSGPSTNLSFANGTSLTLENFARVTGNLTNVDSGQSFYDKFCSENHPLPPNDPPKENPLLPLVPGYPPAVVKTNATEISGYYLDGDGYEDVAVLSVLTFSSASPEEYQKVTETFFSRAKRDGKTKLVVDLSQNGGGLILLGYDMFRQFFPNTVQTGNSRWRANDNFLSISRVFSTASENFDPNTTSELLALQASSTFNYREDLNISNQPFDSYTAKFGPNLVKNDKFTNLMRWDLDDPLLTSNSTFGLGIDITGYGSRKNFSQPFLPENIILLYDGVCASTCTIFSQFMREMGGVKSIALGGLPTEGPIQGVGGVKGSQILLWKDIYDYAQIALLNSTEEETQKLQLLTTLPLSRSSVAASNVRDAILDDHVDDGTPAQFIKSNSDCRLYFSEHMMTDITAVWRAAADSAFNGKGCAYGSFPSKPANKPSRAGSMGFMIEKTEFVTVSRSSAIQSPAWLAVHNQKVIN